MKKILVAIISCILFTPAVFSQIQITKNGKPTARILSENTTADSTAAVLLQNFIEKISDARLPILSATMPSKKNDIIIGKGSTEGLTEDGFRLRTSKGRLYISSGGDKGSIYGVVTLLEKLGVNYYGFEEYTLTPTTSVKIPSIDIAENPAFRYRQSQSYALKDPIYRMWMRLEEPRDEFAAGLWVHTFDHLLPSGVYGAEHPEYYSYINGKRRPGKASQWCLSNPEVFEIVSARIDSIFEANPDKNMISVAQNDGNHTYCTCELCSAVMEREGSPSGIYIEFLNKLAKRRPDKQFSTLAYLFTMQPPKHVKPLPNVNIMLCDIDAKREVPLTDNLSGRDFVKALEGWSNISDNIFVWDYGINFDGYLAPFPNFPILQKNIRLFHDHNAKMHFSQIAGSRGGDFSEMRTYIVSKLMWNPSLDTDSLMRSFMNGYYGAAAPYLYDYEKLLEGGLLASNIPLWIYDSPVSHKDGMLNKNSRKRYNELFDKAENAVKDDSVYLDRVRRQRLSLQFPELEIARAEGYASDPENVKLLNLFEARVAKYQVPTLNERSNSPLDYVKLYRERYINPQSDNKAIGAKVHWVIPPTDRYRQRGEKALTDGIFGGTSFVESWIGWEGTDGSFIIDLEKQDTLSVVEGDFLHQLGQWIFYPLEFTVSTSKDGEEFTPMGSIANPEDREAKVKFKTLTVKAEKPVEARYIKVDITGVKTCPSWHYGVGSPGWFFIDEIIVK